MGLYSWLRCYLEMSLGKVSPLLPCQCLKVLGGRCAEGPAHRQALPELTSTPFLCFQEMHLEDATRFCPKEERESEQTSFSDQNPRQDQKGGFRSSFRKLFKKK